MNGWLRENTSTQTFTTIQAGFLQWPEASQWNGTANTGATLYPQRLYKLWPHTWQWKDHFRAFYRRIKGHNYQSSFLLEKSSPYLWVGIFFFFPLTQIILHHLQIFTPFLPEPRHQVRQPASFDQCKSSCLPEIYTRIKTDPLNLFASNLMFGSNAAFLRKGSYPCVLKYNGLAFGTGNMHVFRNKILQCSCTES